MNIQRAAYTSSFDGFRADEDDLILGQLAKCQTGDLAATQRDAWIEQIRIMRSALHGLPAGTLCFEYVIPRMGKRVDNILLIHNTVLVLEFKVGSRSFDRSAIRQTIDYALDLRNFHEGSETATIIPILVATDATERELAPDAAVIGLETAFCANSQNLGRVLRRGASLGQGPTILDDQWLNAGYRPTPTIIEASQSLFRGHSVTEITRTEAGADNLGATTAALNEIIDQTRREEQKAVCFVTGVPGAGKTLAGLNLACERRRVDQENIEHAVFLSGNGPLVKVLQEALARDRVAQAQDRGARIKKEDAKREAKAFIQNIHHFRDEYVRDTNPPLERVVVFDEAQRAWDKNQTSKFMRQKRKIRDFNQSEPSFLIGVMDRQSGWAVVVCLVGGGQEINVGEAGIREWIEALRNRYCDWNVYFPDTETAASDLYCPNIEGFGDRVHSDDRLHLGVSIRSFRTQQLSAGIDALLSGSVEMAASRIRSVLAKYPIVVTRSIDSAKQWVRLHARGTERYGMLASSGARRLKPLGIVASGVKDKEIYWFLNDDQDVRSSFYLEDAASEFEIQGLEVDWSVLVWGGDFSHSGDGWEYRAFKGTKWQKVRRATDRQYRCNAYRVLLTRARQGMAIVVPEGDLGDPSRLPSLYDSTWNYLREVIPVLK